RQPVARDRHPRAELLDVARDADHPAAITEMALDLARDRRDREGREAHVSVEVEAVDRLDEAERGDLLEVVQRLALVGIPPRERACQWKRPLDELPACPFVSVVVPAA